MSYNNNFKQQLNNLKETIKQCKDEDFDRLVYKYNLFQLIDNTLENDNIGKNKYTEILNNDTEILNKLYNKYMDLIDAPNFIDESVLNEFLNEIQNGFKQIENFSEQRTQKKEYTIQLTEKELIRYYANKIIEDSLENCKEFHYNMDVDRYEHSKFIIQHKEQIIDRINKDEKVLEVYFDEKDSTINMTFGMDWCPYYYEEYDLTPLQERIYLRDFTNIELRDIGKYIDVRTTRDFIRHYMDNFIENSNVFDDDMKDAIYYCLKEHICNTGFVDKYIDKYEVYINKNNIGELIKGLEKEIDKLYIKEQHNIKEISIDDVHKLVDKYNNKQEFTSEELGKFISKENGIYLAIDNRDGEMYMEDFNDIKKCIDFINEKEDEELEEECR